MKMEADGEIYRAMLEQNSKSQKIGGAIDLMLAKKHDPETLDPKGWLMSEKLDGVRCYWTGTLMFSRNGNPFTPPEWFVEKLPEGLALDGELWTKRDDFQKTVSIVRRQDKNEEWKKVTFMVFDAPLIKKPFKARLNILKEKISKLNCDWVKLCEQTVVKSQEHLNEEMVKVLEMGGEGLMIKDPSSKYEHRRSDKLLKIKKFDDAEAKVTGWEYGTGKNEEVMGAVHV